MKKRAITLLLALVMCLSLCSPAMAEEIVDDSADFTSVDAGEVVLDLASDEIAAAVDIYATSTSVEKGTRVDIFAEDANGSRAIIGYVVYSWVVNNRTGGENGLYTLIFTWSGDVPLLSIRVKDYELRSTSSSGEIVSQGSTYVPASGLTFGSWQANVFHAASNISKMYMKVDSIESTPGDGYNSIVSLNFTQVITVN